MTLLHILHDIPHLKFKFTSFTNDLRAANAYQIMNTPLTYTLLAYTPWGCTLWNIPPHVYPHNPFTKTTLKYTILACAPLDLSLEYNTLQCKFPLTFTSLTCIPLFCTSDIHHLSLVFDTPLTHNPWLNPTCLPCSWILPAHAPLLN